MADHKVNPSFLQKNRREGIGIEYTVAKEFVNFL